MIIKSGLCRKFTLPILLVFEVILTIMFIINGERIIDWIVIIIFECLFALIDVIAIIDAIVTLRTIIMDENGCTICLFKYRRYFEWDEITIKRLERGYRRLFGRAPMQGVYFSVYSSNKPVSMDPYWYCMFKNPFLHFFVYITDLSEEEFISYNPSYVFMKNRIDFFKNMSKWGIELTVE